MRDDDPGPGGSVLSDGLGQDPERAEFELFVAEWTGVDMRHHESSGTWGLGLDSFAWACWKRSKAAERERCAGVCDTIYAAINGAYAAKVCATAIRGRIREHCPFPWTGDNGSVAQCKERGHCGCGA